MKVGTIIASREALTDLSEKELNISISVKIAKLLRDIDEVLQVFNKKRQALFDKYGVDGEEGKLIIPEEKMKWANNELSTLLDEDVELVVTKLNIDDLGDIKIEPKTIANLEWLFD